MSLRVRPVPRPRRALALVLASVPALVAGCMTAPPRRIAGGASTPVAPAAPWTPPPAATKPVTPAERQLATRGSATPPEVASRMGALSLLDVVDLALGNNPVSRTSWAQARAAAAEVAIARSRFLPSIEFDVNGGPSRAISANPARLPANRSTVVPSLSLQYLLFDFGGRASQVSAAREALFAADFTHNATVQEVILQSEQAYFTYQSASGLLAAAAANVATARANLAAAERRREVGVATIADVLQARTALAEAELERQGAEANAQGARASLALAMGLEANSSFDVAADSTPLKVQFVAESVDSLIARAERTRPDLAAARAVARAREAEVRVARSAMFPTITMGSAAGRSYANVPTLEGRTYSLTFGLQVPLTSGLSRQYGVVAARENAAAAASRAEQLRLEAVAQVYASYFALRTAAQRVATAGELLKSAAQSEEVARGRYTEGVGSILDVLTAQTALATARAQSVQARWTWYATLAQLTRDAGVLTPRGTPFRLTSDSSGRTP